MADKSEWKTSSMEGEGRAMDTNTGESPGHQSQSQYLENSPSVEEMRHWTPTGVEPKDYDDDESFKKRECPWAISHASRPVRGITCLENSVPSVPLNPLATPSSLD